MEWIVETLELRSRSFDFSSSEQGNYSANSLLADGTVLFNMVENLEFEKSCCQALICEECGFSGCATGNWLCVRKAGETYLFLPAFKLMSEGAWERDEYSPPKLMRTKGFPSFSLEKYEELRGLTDRFPKPNLVSDLTAQETLSLLQFTAPGHSLGVFGLPINLDRDSIVAITDGDLDQELDALEQLITAVENDEDVLMSDRLDRLIEFHLDISGFPSWSPMGYTEDVSRLNLYDALEGRR